MNIKLEIRTTSLDRLHKTLSSSPGKYGEQERLRLEQQLLAYFKTDKRLSKLRAAKLQSYWKRICSDEEKSRQRNEKILRDFERIEGHLSTVTSRTEKLKILKKQYEEQLKEKYPQWESLINPQTSDEVEMAAGSARSYSEHIEIPHEDRMHPHHSTQGTPPKHFQTNIGAVHDLPYSHSSKPDHSHGLLQHEDIKDMEFAESGEMTLDQLSGGGKVKREFSHEDITSQIIEEVEDEDKLAEVEAEEEKASHKSYPYQRAHVIQPSHSRHDSQVSEHRPSMATLAEEEDEEITENDVFCIEDVQPPVIETPLENLSLDSPVDHLQNTDIMETTTPRSMLKSDSSIKSNSPIPDLTMEGLLFLLKCLQAEIPKASNVDGYYRCQHPLMTARKEIVRQANSMMGESSMDGNAVSMVILEQLTLVARELPRGCLLDDEVLLKSEHFTTESQLRSHLLKESQFIWMKLFDHFCTLLKFGVMGPQEIAAVFVPGLVADKSVNQDKAFCLIVRLLEESQRDDPDDDQSSVTFSSRGNLLLPEGSTKPTPADEVPPLSFGSMIDKPTDEESDFFDQSLPKDPVPLNETAAYKNMLSGTFSSGVPTMHQREEDDTDDDVEKQFASVLSPRTPKSKTSSRSPRPPPLSTTPDPVLDDVMSEISSTSPPISPPVQLNSDTRRSLGSFGASNRGAGIKIGSDLDSDTDIDLPMSRGKTKSRTSLDEDFEFYG